MSTEHQQFENENERLLQSEKDPPEYGASKAHHHSIPVDQHMQHPAQGQAIVRVPNSMPQIEDYFCEALLVTLCCCLPFGIVAIVKSNEVKTRAAHGDQEGALEASKSAKMWSCAGLITGLILNAITIVVSVVLVQNGYFCNNCY